MLRSRMRLLLNRFAYHDVKAADASVLEITTVGDFSCGIAYCSTYYYRQLTCRTLLGQVNSKPRRCLLDTFWSDLKSSFGLCNLLGRLAYSYLRYSSHAYFSMTSVNEVVAKCKRLDCRRFLRVIIKILRESEDCDTSKSVSIEKLRFWGVQFHDDSENWAGVKCDAFPFRMTPQWSNIAWDWFAAYMDACILVILPKEVWTTLVKRPYF